MYDPQPLPKSLKEKLREAGIKKFTLEWQGGDDQGDLEITGPFGWDDPIYKAIQDWAYRSFCYSGAGDGTPYGDNYTYDIVAETIEHESWAERRERDVWGNNQSRMRIDYDK